MAGLGGQSCPLCLRADEPASMVDVQIVHHIFTPRTRVQLCRDCAFAIARAVRGTGELPPPREENSDA